MDALNLAREQQVDEEEEEGYREEDREIGIATLTLVNMMNSTLTDTETETEGPSLLLLRRPYVKSLEGIITQCSQPFGKELTKSDVNGTQSRLLINKADAQTHIYPVLGQNGVNYLKDGVSVKVFNERGKVYKMVLKSWCGNNKSNVLTTGWTAFVKDMDLESELHYVTLWAFRHRHTGDVCFLIAVRRKDNGVGHFSGQSSSSPLQ